MLKFIDEYANQPIMSLRGGRKISSTIEPLINPDKLSILGFYSEDRASGKDKILLINDIREFGDMGIIINSEEDLTDPSDLVKLESIIDMNFELLNKPIVTQSGKKLGKVDNYAIDDITYKIEKIYGKPNSLKTLSANDYIISRRQIVSVSETELIVKDALIKQSRMSKLPIFSPAQT